MLVAKLVDPPAGQARVALKEKLVRMVAQVEGLECIHELAQ